MKFFDKIIEYGILLLVFLTPWQARWIISVGEINGGVWEYGTQSVYATEVLLAVILVLLIVKFVARVVETRLIASLRGRFNFKRLYSPYGALLLFLIYAGVSVFWSIDKNTALIHWRWLVEAGVVLLFLGRIAIRPYESARRLQWAIILSAVIQAMWGIGQWLMQSIPASTILGMAQQSADVLGASVVETLDGRWLRAYGSFPHPNMLGGWLVLGLAVILRPRVLGINSAERSRRIPAITHETPRQARGDVLKGVLLLSSFVIILFGLLVTFSRSAWLAFAVFLVGAILLSLRAKRSNPDKAQRDVKIASSAEPPRNDIWKLTSLTILVVSIFIILFPQPFLTRLDNTSRLEYKSTSERQASLVEGWEIIKKHPLVGVGVGNYGLAVHRDIDNSKPAYYYQPTHNVFLLIWGELGAVGLFLILLIVFLSLRLPAGLEGGSTLKGINSPATAAILSSPRKSLSLKTTSNALSGLLRPLLRPRNDMVFIVPLLVIAMLDHYLWSLYPGLLLLALWLGLTKDKI